MKKKLGLTSGLAFAFAFALLVPAGMLHAQTIINDSFNTISSNWMTFGNPGFSVSTAVSPNPQLALAVSPNGNLQGATRAITGIGPWSVSISWFNQSYLYNSSSPFGFGLTLDLGDGSREAGIVFANTGLTNGFYGVNTAAGTLDLILDLSSGYLQGSGWRNMSISNDGVGNIMYSMGGVQLMSTFYSGDSSPIDLTIAGSNPGNAINGVYFDDLAVTTIPEPSPFALLVLGAGLLLLFVRKRRHVPSGT